MLMWHAHKTLALVTSLEPYVSILQFIKITRCCWGHIFDCLSFPFCPFRYGLLPCLPFQHCIHRWGIHVTQFLYSSPQLVFLLGNKICLVDILHIFWKSGGTLSVLWSRNKHCGTIVQQLPESGAGSCVKHIKSPIKLSTASLFSTPYGYLGQLVLFYIFVLYSYCLFE